MRAAWLVLAGLRVVLGGAVARAQSPVIFPPQRIPLRFSHALHLQKKLDCDFCHEAAPRSRSSADNLIPTEEVCTTCHDIDRSQPEKIDRPAARCDACHPGFTPVATAKGTLEVARVVVPAPHLKFNHQVHAERGIGCTRCHGDLRHLDLATRAQLPRMPLCLECHNAGAGRLRGPARCSTCHLTQQDGTLQTDLGSGQLVPSGTLRGDDHTPSFRTDHARVAQNDERYCQNCHRQDFCQSCHNGVVKPLDFHGNDYVSRHPVDARKNDPDCGSCHRRQSFCLGCHERLGVVDLRTGTAGAFVPVGQKTFHPAGWADPSAAGQASHHSWQAQRNLRQCVGCHRQETCLECHGARSGAGQTGKMWVNPHPLGWRGSARCSALASRNLRVCLRCHGMADPELGCQ